jgi:hypothetical protein
MLRLLNVLIVGFIVYWGYANIPNFLGYLIVGIIVLLFLGKK